MQPLHSMHFWFRYIWLLSLIIPAYVGISQSIHPVFDRLTTDDGLSSNKVTAVLQDHEGFYWIATENGLNRFDGSSFRIFTSKMNDSISLTHNYCTALAEGCNGDIWVGTYKGVSRYIKSEGKFREIYLHHPEKNFELSNRIYNVVADGDRNIWIAGAGLWKYDYTRDTIINFQIDKEGNGPSPFGLIKHLVYDPLHNGIWLSAGRELNFYDIDSQAFYKKDHNPHGWKIFENADAGELTLDHKNRLWFREETTQQLSYFHIDSNLIHITGKKIDTGVRLICSDIENRIWFFYWMIGSEIFDPATGSMDQTFFLNHHRLSMPGSVAKDLFIDGKNNYWISTNEGISIYNQINQYYSHYEVKPPANKTDTYITSLAQTGRDGIWIGTTDGLFRYDFYAKNSKPTALNKTEGMIRALCPVGQDLWIGSGPNLVCIDAANESIIRNYTLPGDIFFITRGNQNELWIGLWSEGLIRMELETFQMEHFRHIPGNEKSLKYNGILSGLAVGQDFWIGYNAGNFFSKYSHATNSFQHFRLGSQSTQSATGTINTLSHSIDGRLCIGTYGGGMFLFDTESNSFENYHHEHGLKSNFINSILPDQNGNLWISTADGLNYFNINTGSITPLEPDLVFVTNEITPNGIRGLDNKLYFFCNDVFVAIDPVKYAPDPTFPKIVVSNFKIFDEEIPLSSFDQEIKLSWRENFFSFEYAALKSHPDQLVSYAYILEGFDKNWNLVGDRILASYTNVPAGEYQFKVKATNSLGKWSDDALYTATVHISPPFWRTWWFYLLSMSFLAACIYAIYTYRLRQLKHIYSIKSKISQDLHDDVGASLSSIHIYSSVAEKELHDNPQRAGLILTQIKQNSRQVMDNMSDIIWAINASQPDNETLVGRIKNYGYELLSQKNIHCRYEIGPNVENKLKQTEARKNVLLIVKEAINNISKYSDATEASVDLAIESSHLVIRIHDNGKGFDISHRNGGNGLKNMKFRTDSLGGSLDVKSAPGSGTIITGRIPLANISDR